MGTSCSCSERSAPISIPAGSNDRPRQWSIVQYKSNRSAFNGYHDTLSDYSAILCGVCGSIWRTKAAYVDDLPHAAPNWYEKSDLAPSRESLGLSAAPGEAK